MNPKRGSLFCFHRRRGIAILLHCDPAQFILKFAENFQYEIVMGSDDARASPRAAVHLDLPAQGTRSTLLVVQSQPSDQLCMQVSK